MNTLFSYFKAGHRCYPHVVRGKRYFCCFTPCKHHHLQPLDIAVNKPAKHYLRQQFQDSDLKQILDQLEGQDVASAILQPVDLSLNQMTYRHG